MEQKYDRVPVMSVVGYSDSGKTTVIERILPPLHQKGWQVGVLKHDSHTFDIDTSGKDSYRVRIAGAKAVMIHGRDREAWIVERPPEPDVERFKATLAAAGATAVLIEGFKQMATPKLLMLCREDDFALLYRVQNIIGVVVRDEAFMNDDRLAKRTVYFADDVDGIAEFVHCEWVSQSSTGPSTKPAK